MAARASSRGLAARISPASLPTPWRAAESTVTRALTDIGFGKKFKADFFRDGNVMPKDFEIVAGPDNYESAARFKSESTGLTVRDITYEVGRYFQRKASEAGVIISTLTPGSKGSVAGLKPFEIITHVNGKQIEFAVRARANGNLLMEGSHGRAVVHLGRFFERLGIKPPA